MKTGWILTLTFLITFAAGGAVGLLAQSRNIAAAAQTSSDQKEGKRHMMDELNLTPKQQEKVSAIWHGVCDQMREVESKRSEYEQLRDKAIDALHTEEQRVEVERIQQEFDAHVQQIMDARHKAFEDAKQMTRALLTEEQRVQFDELMARRKAEYDKIRSGWRNRDGDSPENSKQE